MAEELKQRKKKEKKKHTHKKRQIVTKVCVNFLDSILSQIK